MTKTDILAAMHEVREASNQSWIRAMCRESVAEIQMAGNDAEALSVAATALQKIFDATSVPYTRQMIRKFLDPLKEVVTKSPQG